MPVFDRCSVTNVMKASQGHVSSTQKLRYEHVDAVQKALAEKAPFRES